MTVRAPTRPYKGLVPFGDAETDALLFFGRDREREIIVANLMASRLTVLYGPSGVGKTSLLRAGVARHLRSIPDADVAVFSSWAKDPTVEVDEAVQRATGRDLYLILDQIEEYFLYHDRNAPLARRLPELVTTPGLRVNVLLGVREDELAKLDFFKGRIPNLFSNYLRLDHLDRAAASDAITGPLRRLGELDGRKYEAEAELVDVLLDQVATGQIEYGLSGRGVVKGRDEPARIEAPFLQLVLERLWDAEQSRGSPTLRLATLESLGGAETIVRDHLQRALGTLDTEQQELAAQVFDHLVTPSGTKIAHGLGDLAGYARVSRDELRDVLMRLSAERIVRPLDADGTDGKYEIFHDVLAGGVLAWRTNFDAERELRRERARRRRAVALAAVALLALAGVAAVALYALSQRERAEAQAQRARAREFTALAETSLAVDPKQSLRLAVAAAAADPTPQVEDILRRALLVARERTEARADPSAALVAFDRGGAVIVADGEGLRRIGAASRRTPLIGRPVAISSDQRLALVALEGRAVVQDTRTARVAGEFRHAGAIRGGAFDATSTYVGVVAADATGRTYVHVYRIHDGRRMHVFRHRGARAVAFSPDGSLVATGGADDVARIWRWRDAGLIHTLREHTGDVLDIAFSPRGDLLATASADSGTRVWDVANGTRRFLFVEHNDRTVDVAWSRDGRLLADASYDHTSRIYDIDKIGEGRVAATLFGHTNEVNAVAFSFDGERAATVGSDGTLRIWDAAVEHELRVVSRQARGPTYATLDPSGRRAVTAGVDGAAVVDLSARRRIALIRSIAPAVVARFDPSGRRVVIGGRGRAAIFTVGGRNLAHLRHRGVVNDAAWTADGRRVVTVSSDGWLRVFDDQGRLVAHLDHGAPLTRVAVNNDGVVAAGALDGAVLLWRRPTAPLLTTGHADAVTALAFSPDGSSLASAGLDTVVNIWRTGTGGLNEALPGHDGGASDVAFNPAGTRIVTTSFSRQVFVWDATDGTLLRDLIGHFGPVNSARFSSDGRWIATTSALAAAIWNQRTNLTFAYLRGHTAAPVRSAQFTPDGRFVVTAGDDGTVRDYRCELCGGIDELVVIARRRLARARGVR